MTDREYWNDKRVLVTGGTSGLGEALTGDLVENGAEVAIVARQEDGLRRLTTQHPGIVAIRADVSEAGDIRRIVAEALTALGGIDVLINNASYLGPTPLPLLIDTISDDLERVLATNLLGPFRLTKAVLPDMLLRGRGVVVNIGSDAGVEAYPRWGSYGTSKAALRHMTSVFDSELRDRGIRFLSTDPGDMRTPMHFAAIPDADPEALIDPIVSARRILELVESTETVSIGSKV